MKVILEISDNSIKAALSLVAIEGDAEDDKIARAQSALDELLGKGETTLDLDGLEVKRKIEIGIGMMIAAKLLFK